MSTAYRMMTSYGASRSPTKGDGVATEPGRRGADSVVVSAVLDHAWPVFTLAVCQHALERRSIGSRPTLSSKRSAPGVPALAIGIDRAKTNT